MINLRTLNRLLLPVYLYKLRKIRKELYISRKIMEKNQNHRLFLLIQHAYNKVQYYRDLFNQTGIKPDQIKNLKALSKIPITGRKQFQKRPIDNFLSKGMDLDMCHSYITSGATGVPLNVVLSNQEKRLKSLFFQMVYFENGCSIKDKTLHIVGERHFGDNRLYNHLGIMRASYISPYSHIDKILERFFLFKPTILNGFVSSLVELSLRINKTGLRGIRVKKIFTTAEVLGKRARELISSTFQAEVFDCYASNEASLIAWECEKHNGLHINNSNIILEIVDSRGNPLKEGEGRIVITNLSSFTMPFIRYETGDWGILSTEQCSCGRKSLLLKRILGRVVEFIALPTKTINPYYYLTDIIDAFSGIEQYQVVQTNKKIIKIEIVKNDKFKEEKMSQLLEKCLIILGGDIDLKYEIVTNIKKSKSGKYKTIIPYRGVLNYQP
jgi:phenylacetate-CoA ligase